MKQSNSILAIYPNGRGFGFALMADAKTPIDSRTIEVSSKSHTKHLKKIVDLIEYYRPNLLVLETQGAHKSKRVQKLMEDIVKLSEEHNTNVCYYSREQIREVFNAFDAYTRYEIAHCIYNWFPQLGLKLPSVKKVWQSEDFNMGAYDALSLALTHYYLE